MREHIDADYLLDAIREEVNSHPFTTIVGQGVYSEPREYNGTTYHCFYSGENLVPFAWQTPDGEHHSDYKVGDVHVVSRGREAMQFCLTASGVVVETLKTPGRPADATDIGFLMAVVPSRLVSRPGTYWQDWRPSN
jgi:hypothetical protein